MIFQMMPFRREISPALTGFKKIKRAFYEISLSGRHGTLPLSISLKFLEMLLVELRLWVKSINMGRAAFHHQKNTTLSLGRVMSTN